MSGAGLTPEVMRRARKAAKADDVAWTLWCLAQYGSAYELEERPLRGTVTTIARGFAYVSRRYTDRGQNDKGPMRPARQIDITEAGKRHLAEFIRALASAAPGGGA